MPRRVFAFDSPDRFVAGTVGRPGERAFYLQARSGRQVVSVLLEKGQVAALAERLTDLLDEVRRREGDPSPPDPPVDTEPLDAPVEAEFRVGAMALGWDGERVVFEAQAVTEGEEPEEPAAPLSDEDDGPDVLRVALGPGAARSFVLRAERVVSAGRPPCPLCGLPLDPTGHVCPRHNGHRPTTLGA
jgi:uncharacterized repeat protein (TIGR03847 family)